MFFDRDIKGNRLPPKTLCLTYDDGPGETAGDGPGPHTRALARSLFEQGVPATFFLVGARAARHPDILRDLCAWGHLVANHTYSHPGLVQLALSGGDVVEELARTEEVIRPHVAGDVVFVRAPYGSWREKKGPGNAEDRGVSIVAERCNRSGRLRRQVGPVNWDISGHDYDYWRRGDAAEVCLREYLERIETAGRGIVLMHDSSEEEAVRVNNRTLELTRLLVPVLKGKGYRFVRLDEVPQVRSAVRVACQVALRSGDGELLTLLRDGGDGLAFVGSTDVDREAFGVVPLGAGRVALRASNGLYLSVQPGGEILANGPEIGGRETFAVEERRDGQVSLRTAEGACPSRGDDGKLSAKPGQELPHLALEHLFVEEC
jgi:peptidoglycan/xylan/chitin deacetylase (PgdA/CDA1 family)